MGSKSHSGIYIHCFLKDSLNKSSLIQAGDAIHICFRYDEPFIQDILKCIYTFIFADDNFPSRLSPQLPFHCIIYGFMCTKWMTAL